MAYTEEDAAKYLDAERDKSDIKYGEIAHWWRRKAIQLQTKLLNSPQKCSNCGKFHPEYNGYCPARDDGGY